MGKEFDAVAGGDRPADASADAGLLAGGDMIDRKAVFDDAPFEHIEVAVIENLERHQVDAGFGGAAQDETVVIKFIGRLQIDAAVGTLGHLMQSDTIGVVFNRSGHVEYAQLNESGSQYACLSHAHSSLVYRPFGLFSLMTVCVSRRSRRLLSG